MSQVGRVIVAGAVLGAVGWYLYRNKTAPEGVVTVEAMQYDVIEGLQGAAQFVDDLSGGMLKISNMSSVTAADVANENVKAMLRVIRAGEGTADAGGYRRLFGGGTFDGFADHPRIVVSKSGYKSSAAGAYQILASTWDETKKLMGLKDFSPASQDWAAVGRIAARGALADVKAGRFETAIKKLAREWASLPFSPYGQPVISMDRARTIYVAAGGFEASAGVLV